MANLINVERASVGYGTRTLLNGVSLGVDEGDAIGVVGRNGDGKTTLLQVLTATRPPDTGRVTHTSGLSVGYLRQADDFAAGATVREVIVGLRADELLEFEILELVTKPPYKNVTVLRAERYLSTFKLNIVPL